MRPQIFEVEVGDVHCLSKGAVDHPKERGLTVTTVTNQEEALTQLIPTIQAVAHTLIKQVSDLFVPTGELHHGLVKKLILSGFVPIIRDFVCDNIFWVEPHQFHSLDVEDTVQECNVLIAVIHAPAVKFIVIERGVQVAQNFSALGNRKGWNIFNKHYALKSLLARPIDARASIVDVQLVSNQHNVMVCLEPLCVLVAQELAPFGEELDFGIVAVLTGPTLARHFIGAPVAREGFVSENRPNLFFRERLGKRIIVNQVKDFLYFVLAVPVALQHHDVTKELRVATVTLVQINKYCAGLDGKQVTGGLLVGLYIIHGLTVCAVQSAYSVTWDGAHLYVTPKPAGQLGRSPATREIPVVQEEKVHSLGGAHGPTVKPVVLNQSKKALALLHVVDVNEHGVICKDTGKALEMSLGVLPAVHLRGLGRRIAN